MVYGYRLNPDVSEQRAIGMLKEVEEELQRRIRNRTNDSSAQSEVEPSFQISLVSLHQNLF